MKNISIGVKLTAAFVFIASLTAIVSGISFVEFQKIQVPLKEEIPQAIHEVEKTSYLDSLAQKIQYYDSILTESVRNYARTGNRRWKYRYNDIEPKLDKVIQEAISKGDDEDEQIFQEIQEAKMLYEETEKRSIRAMDLGRNQEAFDLIEAQSYWQSKENYKEKLKEYAERRGKTYGDALVVTSEKVNAVVEDTSALVSRSMQLLAMISLSTLLLAIFIGFLFSRAISKPIEILQRGAVVIGRGNLDYRIPVNSTDEIGNLAKSFNAMTHQLQDSYLHLEDKVKEKTKDLAMAVEKIEQEKVQYEALLSSIGDGMVAMDQEGKVIMLNQQAETMLGVSEDDLMGKIFEETVTSEDEHGKVIPFVKRPTTLALATGRRIVFFSYYLRKDRTRVPVAITVSPIQLDGKIRGAIEIFRDITREKEIDKMKSEFISVVSHELRTPLTTIREGVSLVIDEVLGQVTKEQKKFLSIALLDIDRLKRIIDDLLDISKIEAGKVGLKREDLNLVSLFETLKETFSTRIENRGLELITTLNTSGDFNLYIDRDKIIQVFTNLIGNALKFTVNGSIEIYGEDKGDYVECGVRDTGAGISEEDMEKVFAKFQQVGKDPNSGEKGTGLGLSIAKGIVELHGGRIWVESKLGQGTVFKFILPRVKQEEIFRSAVRSYFEQSNFDGTNFSIIALKPDPTFLKNTANLDHAKLREIAMHSFRQSSDVFYSDGKILYVAMKRVSSEAAGHAIDRLKQVLSKTIDIGIDALPIQFGAVSVPEDEGDYQYLMGLLKKRLENNKTRNS